jgi:hypothetical protein
VPIFSLAANFKISSAGYPRTCVVFTDLNPKDLALACYP